jgi:ribosomal protein S27E
MSDTVNRFDPVYTPFLDNTRRNQDMYVRIACTGCHRPHILFNKQCNAMQCNQTAAHHIDTAWLQ